MLRTHEPKYVSYFGDGSGRDSYVIVNNGGLTSEIKPNLMRRPFINTNRDLNKSPHKEAMTITYHSDGSGRDSYVL